jgi:hypothetical protein
VADPLRRFLAGLRPPSEPDGLPEEPADLDRHPAWNRTLKTVPPPIGEAIKHVTLEEARRMIAEAQRDYLHLDSPTHALLTLASPGVGKTHAAVKTAEDAAAEGKRVLYCGPRHDFFGDVLKEAERPDWWYEWQPRRVGDEAKGIEETCRYTPAISSWMNKGYGGIDFCRSVCGWDFVNGGCPYHAQKAVRAPIIFGQHQHVWGGHPLKFDVLIGDESPFAAFCHEWVIPARSIYPEGMDPQEPIAEVLYGLQGLAQSGAKLEGPQLLSALGGAAHVREACDELRIPLDAAASAPSIHSADEALGAPYFHLFRTAALLQREATAAEAGRDYPHRIVVANGNLLLLLRRRVNKDMPWHVLWLDATADPHIYEAILGRPIELVAPSVEMRGRIFQVYDRANGKGALLDGKGGEKTALKDLKRQVAKVAEKYQRVGVITHMALEPGFRQDYRDTGHFYAERGTNRFGECDALVVAGLPQPPLFQIDKIARMLFWGRMEPFANADGSLPWSVIDKPFACTADDGQGRAYPASGLWSDPDLKAVLFQFREAELIQAAHRGRPMIRPDVDVWLIENLPVDELPPTQLLSAREVFGAPLGVDIYRWPDVLALADLYWEEGRALTPKDLEEHLGIRRNTAVEYWRILKSDQSDRWTEEKALRPSGSPGRPRLTLVPRAADPFSTR